MPETIHSGPQSESIIETHLGLRRVSDPLRNKLEDIVAGDFGNTAMQQVDLILDELLAAMMPRTGYGAVCISRIKRGEI